VQSTELPNFELPSLAEAKCLPDLTPSPGSLSGKSALLVVTSHSKLGDQTCTDCKATGVYGEELFAPYYMFKDAGMNTTIVTIDGGDVPVDPTYNTTLYRTSWDKRWWADPQAYADSHNTLSVDKVDFSKYDIVFMAGGWGAAWDMGTSDALAAGITKVYANPT
jgi:putative intracellular protease/amidase